MAAQTPAKACFFFFDENDEQSSEKLTGNESATSREIGNQPNTLIQILVAKLHNRNK
jgi:hypothetical protein